VARRAAESRATVPTSELSVPAPGGPLTVATLVEACAAALRAHPRANAAYRDGRFELYSRINVGVVISDADGRHLAPTVFDAETKSRAELETEIERLRREADALTAPELSGATFTVWNAAEHGLSAASIPVVTPQAGALAAGTSALTLSCDHRILYGARAAAFLKTVADHLDRGGV